MTKIHCPQKIAILMSTYNGQNYVSDQIKSIQQQDNHEWHLYIRDDGSKDNTLKIAGEIAKVDKRITILPSNNENLGVISSFMFLLESVESDYYMFADQDDWWLSSKIDRAISKMQACETGDTPICFHSELQVVDDNLHRIRLLKNGAVWNDFKHFMFGNCITGCTVMINKALKDKIHFSTLKIDKIMMHDWWFGLVASAFGKVIYDEKPSILYRQHQSNVVGDENQQSTKALMKRSLHLKNEIDGLANMLQQIREFYSQYSTEYIDQSDLTYLTKYAKLNRHSSTGDVVQLITKYPPVRSHFRGKLMLSSFLLFNRRQLFA